MRPGPRPAALESGLHEQGQLRRYDQLPLIGHTVVSRAGLRALSVRALGIVLVPGAVDILLVSVRARWALVAWKGWVRRSA